MLLGKVVSDVVAMLVAGTDENLKCVKSLGGEAESKHPTTDACH